MVPVRHTLWPHICAICTHFVQFGQVQSLWHGGGLQSGHLVLKGLGPMHNTNHSIWYLKTLVGFGIDQVRFLTLCSVLSQVVHHYGVSMCPTAGCLSCCSLMLYVPPRSRQQLHLGVSRTKGTGARPYNPWSATENIRTQKPPLSTNEHLR